MKTKLFKYVPIAIGAIMMMASCADDDEENPQNNNPTVPKPTITISVNGEVDSDIYEVTTGDTIELNMTALAAAGGGADLDVVSLSISGVNASNSTFTMTASANGSGNDYDFTTDAEVDIRNADNESLSLSGTFTNITANTGVTTYEFTVKDKDGLIGRKSFQIQVSDPTTPFTSTETGEIWHIAGQNRGSWNLAGDSSVSAVGGQNESEAHIINTNGAGVTFTGSFKVGDNVSNTTFVKAASSFDYANATVESANIAFTAGTATTVTATAPSVDDVFIYDVNGDYIIVKITAIDPAADCGAGCANPGKLTFEYKK